MFKNLEKLGWNESWQEKYDNQINKIKEKESFFPARISAKLKNAFLFHSVKGEALAEISGNFRRQYMENGYFTLAAGDWVIIKQKNPADFPLIYDYLQRGNEFSRKKAGRSSEEQILSANLDLLLVVSTFDRDFRIRRFERYLSLINHVQIKPLIILNKLDLVDSPQAFISEMFASGIQEDFLLTSAQSGQGITELKERIPAGKTACLVGSSGVGKSTLLNRLMESEIQQTNEIRLQDRRGRHTTCTRQLFCLPQGGVVIDNPGLREIGLTGDDSGMETVFSDISELAQNCQFRDCRHEGEPGCAVQEALLSGELRQERFLSYLELQKESRHNRSRKRAREKQIAKFQKELNKERKKRYDY